MSDFLLSTRRKFQRVLFAEGMMTGIAVGAYAAAILVLLARARIIPYYGWVFDIFCPLFIFSVIFGLLQLRKTPSKATCIALTEDATHAGGRLLVDNLPGAAAWPKPQGVCPHVPFHPKWGFLPALALLTLVWFIPERWFAAALPPEQSPLLDVTAEIKNELESLKEEEKLEPEVLETLQEELARIEAAANPTEPAATLEAVDRLQARVQALLDLNSETLKHIAEQNPALAQLAQNPEAAKALQQMLQENSSGQCPNGEEIPGQPCPGEGEGEGTGEGEGEGEGEDGDGKPGKGGTSRGRGDAEMRWGKDAEMKDSKFKDQTQKADPKKAEGEQKVGQSISDEDPAKNATHTGGYGTTAIGGRSAGASVSHPVSPQHRGTVKRFFEMERKEP